MHRSAHVGGSVLGARWLLAAVLLAAWSALPVRAQMEDVQIRTIPVAPGIHMLTGRGGNIGVSTGSDGAFVIDDQYAPLHPKIRAAVAAIDPAPIRFVFNTHWHGDHTGGNAPMAEAGALIVAHENVRRRMSNEQFNAVFGRTTPASPEIALPVVTFDASVTFHRNGQEIHAFHVEPAHTDGDAILHFRGADVLHLGDVFFNGSFPFVDASSGGRFLGVLTAVDRALALCGPETKIIPGHGPLAGRADLQGYRAMLETVRERGQAAVAAGLSAEQWAEEKPLADLDARWGQGFMKSDVFLKIVHASLAAEPR